MPSALSDQHRHQSRGNARAASGALTRWRSVAGSQGGGGRQRTKTRFRTGLHRGPPSREPHTPPIRCRNAPFQAGSRPNHALSWPRFPRHPHGQRNGGSKFGTYDTMVWRESVCLVPVGILAYRMALCRTFCRDMWALYVLWVVWAKGRSDRLSVRLTGKRGGA